MVFIYILELQHNKYYVGKTSNPRFSLEDHYVSETCAWTRLYRPILVRELIPDCDTYDEDKYTKMYMERYGIDNVRGGSYLQPTLSPSQITSLKRIQRTIIDTCYKCGNSDHCIKDCPFLQHNTKRRDGYLTDDDCNSWDDDYDSWD